MQRKKDLELLRDLCAVPAPSGDEREMTRFILEYVEAQSGSWKCRPTVVAGEDWQDNVMLIFGEPRTAVFAHMDSIGFTVRYEDQLVPIGSPHADSGARLVGRDILGLIDCELIIDSDGHARYRFGRAIQTGTTLTWRPDFRQYGDYIQSGYMDNRLGVYCALKCCEDLENGAIVFSTWEEHGGGSVPYLLRYLWEKHKIKQALISDITWVTEGVAPGNGVVISMRDRNIPRKSFLDRIISLAENSGIPFQLEVEGSGSSDGREVQQSPYPVDWCFIGAPEEHVHTPNEKVHIDDIGSMVEMYRFLLRRL